MIDPAPQAEQPHPADLAYERELDELTRTLNEAMVELERDGPVPAAELRQALDDLFPTGHKSERR